MDLFDEDLFSGSDEDDRVGNVDSLSTDDASNPVKEHLLRQLDDTTERVEKARGNVDRVRAVTEEIRRKLELRETRGVSSESDTEESELYQVTGDPVIPKKRIRKQKVSESLRIDNIWQRVIDDKWIIGICLENRSNRTLFDPRAYIMVKGETETRSCSSFWEINDLMASSRTDQIAKGQANKTIATVVVDLPDFSEKDYFVAFGTICYNRGEKNLQIPVPPVRLTCHDVVDKKFAPKFSNGPEHTILALKSISADRELIIPHDKEGIGARLGSFLNDNAFKPIGDEFSDVYVAEGNEFLRRCIFEVLELKDTGAPVRISARTPKQLEITVSLLRAQFSDLVLKETKDRETEAARALERELELELAGDDPEALRLARFITDLLIP